jgi:uncharacterized membrane protein
MNPLAHIVIEPEGITQYIGYFHPALNHFPIVLVYITFFFDLMLLATRDEKYAHFGRGMLLAAGILGIPTAITGLFAWDLGLEANPYVPIHLTLAVITIFFIWIHFFIRYYKKEDRRLSLIYTFLILSCLNVILINITSEYGGIITWGRGIFIKA